MLGKEVERSWDTCCSTYAVLEGWAEDPWAETSHRGPLIMFMPTTRNRWWSMRACIFRPGLWNVSAVPHSSWAHASCVFSVISLVRERRVTVLCI